MAKFVVGTRYNNRGWDHFWTTDNLPNARAAFEHACAMQRSYVEIAIFCFRPPLWTWWQGHKLYYEDRRNKHNAPISPILSGLINKLSSDWF